MRTSDQDKYYQLSYYTLEHPDKDYFIHQHIVDAYTAQKADENSKPISIIFSLAGLYLYLERNYSGRQVQLAHMKMAGNKKGWPIIKLPVYRGEITVSEVLATPAGSRRDNMIREWCSSVWQAYTNSHGSIAALVKKQLGI
jgi:hypothetical protein